jgi:hypothetical protein
MPKAQGSERIGNVFSNPAFKRALQTTRKQDATSRSPSRSQKH